MQTSKRLYSQAHSQGTVLKTAANDHQSGLIPGVLLGGGMRASSQNPLPYL